jgi:DNA-binding MarR family transcriptional regulator
MSELSALDRQSLIALLHTETRAQSACTLFFHNTVGEHLGLNTTDHKCLDLVFQAQQALDGEPMTPGQLARATGLTTGAVTGVLDRLERAGFIERHHDADDRRRIIIRCTADKVEGEVAPIFGWLQGAFEGLCSEYSDEQLRLLIEFARRCQGLLKEATTRLQEEAPEDAPSPIARPIGLRPSALQ